MTGDKEVQILRMTLDELINAMEPQARKDKALISKCVDGLTEYAAELRQKAGDAGKEQISALRRLVDELAGYWGLDAKTVDHVTAFDRKIQEVDQAVHQWTPIHGQRDDTHLHDEPGPGGKRIPQRQCKVGPPKELQGRKGLLPL